MGTEKIWSILIHFGTNMWNEQGNTRGREQEPDAVASDTLRFDRAMFRELAVSCRDAGINTIILDLGEGLIYESHPELAVNGSWTHAEMEAELAYLRGLGLSVIPKLNFSAGHDLWLGEYSRMLSTSVYYRVCADLIKEVCELFRPQYFHLGMDEETASHQRNYDYTVIRQNDLWWHDFYHLVDCVERENVRPWIWSDYMWNYPDVFLRKMPKSVVQSNWYYGMGFDESGIRPSENAGEHAKNVLSCFETLDRHGFDQVPTGSNYSTSGNMEALTKFCTANISNERLLGFMQTPWVMTHEGGHNRMRIWESVEKMAAAKVWYDSFSAHGSSANGSGKN